MTAELRVQVILRPQINKALLPLLNFGSQQGSIVSFCTIEGRMEQMQASFLFVENDLIDPIVNTLVK